MVHPAILLLGCLDRFTAVMCIVSQMWGMELQFWGTILEGEDEELFCNEVSH